jgi:Xaa-Pro aminopeptidase
MAETRIHGLSLAERDRRWSGIRARMDESGLDALIIRGISTKWDSGTANIRYVSQIGGNGEEGMVVFPRRGDPIVLVWSPTQLEWWPQAQDWVSDIRLGSPDWGEKTVACINELGLGAANIGVVGIGGSTAAASNTMAYDIYRTILDGLPAARFSSAAAIFEELRVVKSAEELAFMARSAELCDIGIDALLGAAKPGVRAYEVYGEILGSIYRAGGESPMFLMYEADRAPRHALRFPSDRTLEPGYMILQEISPKFAGYWSQAMVPVSLGRPEQAYLDLGKVVAEAYQAAIETIRAGVSVRTLADAINAPIIAGGFSWLRPQWQGLGLEQVEAPTHPHKAVRVDTELVLQEGMVLGLQPMAGTADGRYGLQMGDTVVVTAEGARRLGRSEMKFHII